MKTFSQDLLLIIFILCVFGGCVIQDFYSDKVKERTFELEKLKIQVNLNKQEINENTERLHDNTGR